MALALHNITEVMLKNSKNTKGLVVGLMLLALSLIVSTKALADGSVKTRLDFNDLQIRGQTKKAGTVYIYDRGQLNQKSNIKLRVDYKKEILEKPFL